MNLCGFFFKSHLVNSKAPSGLQRAFGGPMAPELHRQGLEKPLGPQLLSLGCGTGLMDKAAASNHFRTTAMAEHCG